MSAILFRDETQLRVKSNTELNNWHAIALIGTGVAVNAQFHIGKEGVNQLEAGLITSYEHFGFIPYTLVTDDGFITLLKRFFIDDACNDSIYGGEPPKKEVKNIFTLVK